MTKKETSANMKSSKNSGILAEIGIVFLILGIIFFMEAVNEGSYNSYINATTNQTFRFLIEYMGFLGIVIGISLLFLSSSVIKKTLKTILRIDSINYWVKGAILFNLLLLFFYVGADGIVWFNMVYRLFVVNYLDYNLWMNSFQLLARETNFTLVYQNVTLIIFAIAVILNTTIIFIFQKLRIIRVNAWLKSVILLNLIFPVFYVILDYFSWMNINVSSEPSLSVSATFSYNVLINSISVYGHFPQGMTDITVSYVNTSFIIFLFLILLNLILLIKSQVIQTDTPTDTKIG